MKAFLGFAYSKDQHFGAAPGTIVALYARSGAGAAVGAGGAAGAYWAAPQRGGHAGSLRGPFRDEPS